MMRCSRITILASASATAVALALAGVDWLDTGTARQRATVIPGSPSPPIVAAEDATRPAADPSAVGDLADARSNAMEAIVALADVPGQNAESALVNAALGNTESAIREEAIHWLGQRGGAVALQTSQQALQDPSPRVRRSAIRAFVDIGGNEAVWALGSALGAADVSMRVNAVDALGEIGGADAMRYLQQVLGDENDVVREAAAEWLAELSGGTDPHTEAGSSIALDGQ